MTDNERCGYLLGDGSGCDNPTTEDGESGRCWIDSHNETPMSNGVTPGRPSKFNDERAQQVIQAARQAKSKGGCARAAGVDRATVHRWLQDSPEFTDASGQKRDFRTAFAQARGDGETILVQGGLRNDDIDSSFAKFLLKTSFDYREVQEIRMDDTADIPEADEKAKQHIDALVEAEPET